MMSNQTSNKSVKIEKQNQFEIILDSFRNFEPSYTTKILTIDSCEYIVWNNVNKNDINLTHKGNCKFCQRRKNN